MSQGNFPVVPRDPIDVLHVAAKAYPDGIAGVARKIGRSPGILHNKFSEAMPNYDLMFREAMAIAHLVGSSGFAEAVAEQFGGVFVPVTLGKCGDDDVLQDYLDIIRAMGDLSLEFTEARADGVIEPSEFNALSLRAMRTVAAILRMVKDIEQTVREVPPPAPLKKVAG